MQNLHGILVVQVFEKLKNIWGSRISDLRGLEDLGGLKPPREDLRGLEDLGPEKTSEVSKTSEV